MQARFAILLFLPLAACTSTGGADVTRQIAVGQTGHITAYRGSTCSAPAPSFAEIQGRLPRSEIVRYSDGGPSSRVSNDCGRSVPTRAVNGTGLKAGQEVHRFQSGTVAIVVR